MSKGSSRLHRVKNPTTDSTKAYSHCRIFRNVQLISTSQANPQELMDLWRKELETYEELVYIPLSSGLSGSCSTAQAMAMD
ncbi:MAG: DegV family protein, partial [Alistipes sp.]|nr:DegV family protein [Alistipes sp.]